MSCCSTVVDCVASRSGPQLLTNQSAKFKMKLGSCPPPPCRHPMGTFNKKVQLRHAYVQRQETELALKYRRLEILSRLVSIKIVTLHRQEQLAQSTTIEHRLERLQSVEKSLHSSGAVVQGQLKQLQVMQRDLKSKRDQIIAQVWATTFSFLHAATPNIAHHL